MAFAPVRALLGVVVVAVGVAAVFRPRRVHEFGYRINPLYDAPSTLSPAGVRVQRVAGLVCVTVGGYLLLTGVA